MYRHQQKFTWLLLLVFTAAYIFASYRWGYDWMATWPAFVRVILLLGAYILLAFTIFLIRRRSGSAHDRESRFEDHYSQGKGNPPLYKLDEPLRDWEVPYGAPPVGAPQTSSGGGSGGVEKYYPSSPAPVKEQDDRVSISLSCPGQITAADDFAFQVAIHLPEQQASIASLLTQLAPDNTHALAAQQCKWKRGTEVSLRASAQHLRISPAEQSFVWEGEAVILSFDAAGIDLRLGQRVSLKIDVLIAGIVVARVRMVLTVSDTTNDRASQKTVQPYRSAFASYASADTNLVIGRLHEIERNGVKIFWDRISLQTGKDWQEQLHQAICSSDSFILFWSRQAAASKWVTWEWQTALQAKGIEAIDPHPLETAAEAPPPDALRSLHFDDKYLYFRK